MKVRVLVAIQDGQADRRGDAFARGSVRSQHPILPVVRDADPRQLVARARLVDEHELLYADIEGERLDEVLPGLYPALMGRTLLDERGPRRILTTAFLALAISVGIHPNTDARIPPITGKPEKSTT